MGFELSNTAGPAPTVGQTGQFGSVGPNGQAPGDPFGLGVFDPGALVNNPGVFSGQNEGPPANIDVGPIPTLPEDPNEVPTPMPTLPNANDPVDAMPAALMGVIGVVTNSQGIAIGVQGDFGFTPANPSFGWTDPSNITAGAPGDAPPGGASPTGPAANDDTSGNNAGNEGTSSNGPSGNPGGGVAGPGEPGGPGPW